jgi:hypothetical protein
MVVDGPWMGISVTDKGTNQKVYVKLNNEWKNVRMDEVKEIFKEIKNAN